MPVEHLSAGAQIILAAIGMTTTLIIWRTEATRQESKRSTNASRLATEAAQTAADQTNATGNGYAARTELALVRIERELAGMRDDHRGLSRRIEGLGARVDRHHPPDGSQI